jgi:putative transposase
MTGEYRLYRHAPPHFFLSGCIYFVTAGTYRKRDLFKERERLAKLQRTLLEQIDRFHWDLHAWVVFSNHYHFAATASDDPDTLTAILRGVHSIAAKYVNQLDHSADRRVWSNFWDTCITNKGPFLERLNYIHYNAVKHGLAERPEDNEFCSYAWFLETADEDIKQAAITQPYERILVEDNS